jgi:hypothetical protein
LPTPCTRACKAQLVFSPAESDKAGTSQTDTHGWLEGHLKEQNYGADWGDYKTFTEHMKHKAGDMGVDLLIIDTGNSKSITILDTPMDPY